MVNDAEQMLKSWRTVYSLQPITRTVGPSWQTNRWMDTTWRHRPRVCI